MLETENEYSLLMISADFPPDSSPGAIRNFSFAKRLKELGLNVAVATENHASEASRPSWNFSSLDEEFSERRRVIQSANGCSKGIKLSRHLRILDDSYQGVDNLVDLIVNRHSSQPFDLIYASCNPISVAVAGAKLKEKLKIPLVGP